MERIFSRHGTERFFWHAFFLGTARNGFLGMERFGTDSYFQAGHRHARRGRQEARNPASDPARQPACQRASQPIIVARGSQVPQNIFGTARNGFSWHGLIYGTAWNGIHGTVLLKAGHGTVSFGTVYFLARNGTARHGTCLIYIYIYIYMDIYGHMAGSWRG